MTKLFAVVLALAIAGSAAAQSKGKRGPRGEGKGQRESVDLYHVTAEELRADLKLTDSQAPLWERYLQKVEALKEDVARDRARARASEAADAPRALDRMVDVQRDRLTAMEDIAEAGRALYKMLDTEQRAVADTRLARLVAAATSVPPR